MSYYNFAGYAKNDDQQPTQPTKDALDIYNQGWNAGYNDLVPECPYPEGSPEAKSWWDGYEIGSSDC